MSGSPGRASIIARQTKERQRIGCKQATLTRPIRLTLARVVTHRSCGLRCSHCTPQARGDPWKNQSSRSIDSPVLKMPRFSNVEHPSGTEARARYTFGGASHVQFVPSRALELRVLQTCFPQAGPSTFRSRTFRRTTTPRVTSREVWKDLPLLGKKHSGRKKCEIS